MKSFLTVLFCSALFSGFLAQAQGLGSTVDINDPTHLVKQGKLFTVKIVPGDRKTSFYIVGNKAAEIKFSKLEVVATVFGPSGSKEILNLSRKTDYFEHGGLLTGEKVQLQIKNPEVPSLKENIEIRLKATP